VHCRWQKNERFQVQSSKTMFLTPVRLPHTLTPRLGYFQLPQG
jgi:hypothetical protein